jgi:hypothetical protein
MRWLADIYTFLSRIRVTMQDFEMRVSIGPASNVSQDVIENGVCNLPLLSRRCYGTRAGGLCIYSMQVTAGFQVVSGFVHIAFWHRTPILIFPKKIKIVYVAYTSIAHNIT